MAEKIRNKIMNTNYRKTAKVFIIISLIAFLVGGTVSAFSLKTQIGEVISYHQAYEIEKDTYKQEQKEKYFEDKRYDRHFEHSKYDDYDEYEKFFENANITEPSMFAKVSVSIFCVICGIIGIVYWCLIAAWLYKTAYKSSMSGVLWGILGLMANLGAVVLFFIIRDIANVRRTNANA